MPKNISIEPREYNCDRCGLIRASVEIVRHFSDEGHDLSPDREIVARVHGYGSCQVAASAAVPGHPVLSELSACPVFSEL
jgi:hypothetical protein